MKKRWVHFLLVGATIGIGAAVDILTKSHAVWAPTAVALLANLRTLLMGADETPKVQP